MRGLSQQQAANGTRWLWFSLAGNVYRWYGPAAENITYKEVLMDETLSAPAGFIDFTHYGDWTIINGGSGAALVHKPGAPIAAFGDAPVDVVRFMKKLNFMLAVGYGSRGTRVGWSGADAIESWTPSKTSEAGSISFDEMETRIKAAARLGNAIAVYAEDQMGLLSYIGAPFYFGQRTALDGIGASGKFSVASDGNNNFGVGRGGVWWTDGLSYRYIDEGYLHDYLQDNVNWAQQSKITACRNDYTGCMEFSFPMRGALEPNEAWSFDPRTSGWSPIPAFSLKDERRLFQKPIVGLSDGRVMRDQDLADGNAPLTLRTKPILPNATDGAASPHVSVKVDEIILLAKKAAGVQFRLGGSQQMEGPYAWSPWQTIVTDSKTYTIADTPSDGVFFKLEFRSIADSWALDLQGFLLFGQVDGSKRD